MFSGDGSHKQPTQAKCAHLPNVRFIPFQPQERLGELLTMADIHLLPQKIESSNMVLPSKLTGMLSSGRPIVTMALPHSELGEIATRCGAIAPFGDDAAFAREITKLARNDALRSERGENARKYACHYLECSQVLATLNDELQRFVDIK